LESWLRSTGSTRGGKTSAVKPFTPTAHISARILLLCLRRVHLLRSHRDCRPVPPQCFRRIGGIPRTIPYENTKNIVPLCALMSSESTPQSTTMTH
jgi:hypothetical protein